MRPVMHGDVVAAARVLFGQPSEYRGIVIGQLLHEAAWADMYRNIAGRVHPLWGDGSLMNAALNRRPGAEPDLGNSDYCTCLSMVLEALIVWRGGEVANDPSRRKCTWAPWGPGAAG